MCTLASDRMKSVKISDWLERDASIRMDEMLRFVSMDAVFLPLESLLVINMSKARNAQTMREIHEAKQRDKKANSASAQKGK